MTTDDPNKSLMERFLQPTTRVATPSLVVNRDAATPYVAFDPKDKIIRLHIRCTRPAIAYTVPYAYMIHFDYAYETWDEFSLSVGAQTVTAQGRNLQPVIDAIAMHRCEWIQEYDPARFSAPQDPAAPVIERITVAIIGGGQKDSGSV
jgi:hypothetical protein